MSSSKTLPVILVTAKTQVVAAKLIAEILDQEESEQAEANKDGESEWLIENKYYSARVLLRPLADSEPAPDYDVEAQIVALDSSDGAEEAENRSSRVSAELVLLAVDSTHVSNEITEWAARALAEAVPLREQPTESEEDDEPFAEERGLQRLREALHAHVWPNLRRRSSDYHHDNESATAADEVERAEKFAATLGALGGSARHVASLSGAERCAAAEALVTEFARALGVSLDDL